jgi:hypothetical protein
VAADADAGDERRDVFVLFPNRVTSAAYRAAEPEAIDWVRRNGVDPDTVVGNASVRVADDGETLHLLVWQAVPGPDGQFQRCPNCQTCVAAREVSVPLIAPIPGVVAAAGSGDTDPGWLSAVNQRAQEQALTGIAADLAGSDV